MNTHHIACRKEIIVAQHSPKVRMRSGEHRVDTLIAVIRNNGHSCGGKKNMKSHRTHAMINAIINNNETIPSSMCKDIGRTIFDTRLAILSRTDKRIGQFSREIFRTINFSVRFEDSQYIDCHNFIRGSNSERDHPRKNR